MVEDALEQKMRTLDDIRRAKARRFVRRLSEAGFPIAIAAYALMPDTGRWEFFLETPLVRVEGIKKTYASIDRAARLALREAAEDAGFVEDVTVVLPSSPLSLALAVVLTHENNKAGPPGETSMEVGDMWVEDGTTGRVAERMLGPAVLFYHDLRNRSDGELRFCRRQFDKLMDERLAA